MDPTDVKTLFQYAPALGASVFATLILLGFILRALGISAIGDKAKLVDDGKLNAVSADVKAANEKLAGIERRLGSVEKDVENRATKDEMHRLELAFTRLEGEFKSISMTVQSTAVAIGRIEEYMYAAAMGLRRGE